MKKARLLDLFVYKLFALKLKIISKWHEVVIVLI